MANFELKSADRFSIFQKTDGNTALLDLSEIAVLNLQHYKDHPFKLYTGERLSDMVQSIKENGLFAPLIVRPTETDNSKYEILSGHNRFEACKLAGLTSIPCVVKKNLTEDEAYLVVTESNLIQRSFADLTHSERAVTLATHYDNLKKQGKRSDLINEIEKMILNADKPQNDGENAIYSQVANKSNNMAKTGENYGLSKDTVARYLRINKLLEMIKDMIDNSELSLVAGVSLSYLSKDDQNLLMDYVDDNELKIDIKKADLLKELSAQKKFTIEKVEEIFLGKKIKVQPKKQTFFKIKRKSYDHYFKGSETQEEFEDTLKKALNFYYEYKDGFPEKETNEQSDYDSNFGIENENIY